MEKYLKCFYPVQFQMQCNIHVHCNPASATTCKPAFQFHDGQKIDRLPCQTGPGNSVLTQAICGCNVHAQRENNSRTNAAAESRKHHWNHRNPAEVWQRTVKKLCWQRWSQDHEHPSRPRPGSDYVMHDSLRNRSIYIPLCLLTHTTTKKTLCTIVPLHKDTGKPVRINTPPKISTLHFFMKFCCRLKCPESTYTPNISTPVCWNVHYAKTCTRACYLQKKLGWTGFFLSGFFTPPDHTPKSKCGPKNKYLCRH